MLKKNLSIFLQINYWLPTLFKLQKSFENIYSKSSRCTQNVNKPQSPTSLVNEVQKTRWTVENNFLLNTKVKAAFANFFEIPKVFLLK